MRLAVVGALALSAVVARGEEKELVPCNGENNDLNVVHGLPRMTLGFSSTSGDLEDFDSPVVMCPDDPTNVCQAVWLDELGNDTLGVLQNTAYAEENPGSWVAYGQGVFMYSFVGVFLAVATVLLGIIACCARACCCKAPVLKQYEDGELLKPYEYPVWQTVLTYACLVLFIVLVFTFTLLTHLRGNQGFTDAQLALVDAPDNLVVLAKATMDPVVSLGTSVLGTAMVNTIRRINETVVTTANLTLVHEAVLCAKSLVDFASNSSFIDVFVEIIDNVNETIVSQMPTSQDVDNAVSGVETSITQLITAVNDTVALLSDSVEVLGNVPISAIEADVADIDGDLQSLSTQLAAVETGLQSIKDVKTSSDSVVTAVNNLNAAAYTQAEATAFKDEYALLKTRVDAMATNTGAQVAGINATLDNVITKLENVKTTCTQVQTNLTTVNVAQLTTSVDAIVAAIDSFDLVQLKANLADLLDFLVALPSVQPIQDQIDEILGLQVKVDCVFLIKDIPAQINQTLVELPADLLNFTAQFDAVNDTFASAVTELETARDEVTNFNLTFASDIQSQTDAFDAQIAQANQTLQDAKVQVLALKTELTGFSDPIIDLTGIIASIDATIAAANSQARPTAATISDLDNLATAKSTAQTAFGNPSLANLDSKILALEASAPSDQGCVGASSNICYFLASGFNNACPDCAFPTPELLSVRAAADQMLQATSASSSPTLEELQQLMASSKAQVDGFDLSCCLDLSSEETLLNDATASFSSLTSTQSQISTIESQIAGFKNDFDNLDISVITDLISQVKAQLSDVNATLVSQNFTALEDIFEREASIYELVFQDLGPILVELGKDRLDSIVASEGVGSMAAYVAERLDSIVSKVDPTIANFTEQLDDLVQYSELVDFVRDTDGSLSGKGSIYFLSQVADRAQNITGDQNSTASSSFLTSEEAAVYGDAATATGFLEDGKLVAYPGDKYCLTDACLQATVAYFNDGDLQDVAPQEVSEVVALPLSRTQAMALPFIIPSIILIMAIMIFFIPSCGYALAGCAVCVTPWIFAIVGGLMFPMVILTGDICAGAEGVGANVLQEIHPYVCDQVNGTFNSATGFCELAFTAANETVEIELDAPALIESVLQDCSAQSGANLASGQSGEPVQALIASIGADASVIVGEQLTKLINEVVPGLGVTLRPILIQDIESSANDITGEVENFSDNINESLGCEELNAAYLGFKESMCCEFGQAFYWAFAGWYLIAFCLMLCGIPVGCFAATRLKNIKQSREHLRLFYDQTAQTRFGAAVGMNRVGSLVGMQTATPVDEDMQVANASPTSKSSVGSRFASLGNSFKNRLRRQNSSQAMVEAEIELSGDPQYTKSDV